MSYIHLLSKSVLLMSLVCGIAACSEDQLSDIPSEEKTEESEVHTLKMNLVGGVVGYDRQGQTRAETRATSWKEGDRIYILFYNGDSTIPGEATYSASNGWTVSFSGNLATGSELKCETRYFVNATSSTSTQVTLHANPEIYEAPAALYTYQDNALLVKTNLSPKTGRIRFTGQTGDTIQVRGITTYTTYLAETNHFTTSNELITAAVNTNGSTPYLYGYFAEEKHTIGLIGADCAFTRECTAEVLKAGESGYMAIPTEKQHNNWQSGLYVTASGVEFKMIPVSGYSDGFYLIGETEVTEALYKSVNGTASTSQLPVSSISYSNMTAFINIINFDTKLQFGLPSAAQWKYAAKGGKYSQGYNYSGSDTPGDVAWYSGNASAKQPVKGKAPNELGIYDMSGNVQEMTTEKTNSYFYPYGGSFTDAASSCTVNSRNTSVYY